VVEFHGRKIIPSSSDQTRPTGRPRRDVHIPGIAPYFAGPPEISTPSPSDVASRSLPSQALAASPGRQRAAPFPSGRVSRSHALPIRSVQRRDGGNTSPKGSIGAFTETLTKNCHFPPPALGCDNDSGPASGPTPETNAARVCCRTGSITRSNPYPHFRLLPAGRARSCVGTSSGLQPSRRDARSLPMVEPGNSS